MSVSLFHPYCYYFKGLVLDNICFAYHVLKHIEKLNPFTEPDFTAFVNCDKNRFTQIFGNIITNARKYAKTDIDVSLALEGKEVAIRFRDYGNGIPDEDIPFIFGKFYRGKNCGGEQGSGLGLYIVKYVAEQSGGRVTLKNREKGLEIAIFLPVSESS